MVNKSGSILIFLFFSYSLVEAQNNGIKNLVFEGAGLRGIAYCGAIKELESRKLIAGIEKVGGTSAGAVTALCISLGYNSDEIEKLLFATNFKKFNDGRYFFVRDINRNILKNPLITITNAEVAHAYMGLHPVERNNFLVPVGGELLR